MKEYTLWVNKLGYDFNTLEDAILYAGQFNPLKDGLKASKTKDTFQVTLKTDYNFHSVITNGMFRHIYYGLTASIDGL